MAGRQKRLAIFISEIHMRDYVITKQYDDGEIQRVHVAEFDDFGMLSFFEPEFEPDCFVKLADLYETYIVPKFPMAFGRMLLFTMPKDFDISAIKDIPDYGYIEDPLIRLTIAFKRYVRINGNGRIKISDRAVEEAYNRLNSMGLVRAVCGKRPNIQIIPVRDCMGYITKAQKTASLMVNSNFFIMDCFDITSPYDTVGTPFGLMVKNGVVESPPLFNREAFVKYKDGRVSIKNVTLNDLKIEIKDKLFFDAESKNICIYERPMHRRTRHGAHTDVVIVGNEILAVNKSGYTPVPSSGFILSGTAIPDSVKPGDKVIYHGMEDVEFAVSVGNSVLINGTKTEGFISKFYNIKNPLMKAYPPSLYPLDYKRARAARVMLGCKEDGTGVIAWFEGASKYKHVKGEDSCGASLSEVVAISEEIGVYNGVNLDGGGSAQLLINGKRRLLISDRNQRTGEEAERAIPVGIYIE